MSAAGGSAGDKKAKAKAKVSVSVPERERESDEDDNSNKGRSDSKSESKKSKPRQSSAAGEEAVVVGVRVRPFNKREMDLNAELCISMEGPSTILQYKGKDLPFTFDESFWSHDGFEEGPDGVVVPVPGSNYADQRYVFESFGQRVLDNAWEGFHCCLFAYGQTGSGKSYSMVGDGVNKGIVPISCEEIFHRINSNDNANLRFEVTVSMMEIYNEAVQDLFILPQDRPQGGLEIRESKLLGIYVDGVIKTPVQSYASIEKVIEEATEHRTIGNTLMNATSSRAHTVLSIEFKQVEELGGKETVKLSMIHLVDLAGSEKSGQTGAAGDRLREGCAINKSLSALGNVIEKLAKKSSDKKGKKNIIVPYRDSKLTRLLQNALGGSSKTIMVCAVSPASSNAEETLSTLRFADRVKKIKNTAHVNEDPQGKLLREMQAENLELKKMMESLKGGVGVNVGDLQAKQAELARAEEALKEMQRSFEDKVREARVLEETMRSRGGNRARSQQVQARFPHIVNLNEDIQLNGKLRYYFDEGKPMLVGQPGGDDSSSSSSSSGSSNHSDSDSDDDDDKQPDILLAGEDIHAKHARVLNTEGHCVLTSKGSAAEATFVNGTCIAEFVRQRRSVRQAAENQGRERPRMDREPSTGEDREEGVVLQHADRIAFGNRCLFVFIMPSEGSAEQLIMTGQVTYSMARQELKRNFLKRMRAALRPSQLMKMYTGGGAGDGESDGDDQDMALAFLGASGSTSGAVTSWAHRGSSGSPHDTMRRELAEREREILEKERAVHERDQEIARLRRELAEAHAALGIKGGATNGNGLKLPPTSTLGTGSSFSGSPLSGSTSGGSPSSALNGAMHASVDSLRDALRARPQVMVEGRGLAATIADLFEDALGTLDKVERRLIQPSNAGFNKL